ncbi:MAG TPA: SlyX family protein [Polyangiaceae bacterium]|nr:SlyX family protein [Polyangiaceae bacterium]
MDPDRIEARVMELELRFMKLERELGELSLVVAAQQRVIEALTAEAKRRRERDELAGDGPVGDEKPPHY